MSAAVLRRCSGAAVALAAALSLAACGGTATDTAKQATSAAGSAVSSATSEAAEEDAPSAKDLYAKTRESSLAAKSAKVSGNVKQAGQEMKITLEGQVDGSNQRAEITMGDKGTAEITTIGKMNYIKADEKFWTSQGGISKAQFSQLGLDEKYVATSESMGSDFTFKSLLDDMFKEQSMSRLESLTTPVEKVTEDGVEAWKMSDGDAEVLVTADDKNYLLKIAAGDTGTLKFSDWDAVEEFTAPPAGKVLKL